MYENAVKDIYQLSMINEAILPVIQEIIQSHMKLTADHQTYYRRMVKRESCLDRNEHIRKVVEQTHLIPPVVVMLLTLCENMPQDDPNLLQMILPAEQEAMIFSVISLQAEITQKYENFFQFLLTMSRHLFGDVEGQLLWLVCYTGFSPLLIGRIIMNGGGSEDEQEDTSDTGRLD